MRTEATPSGTSSTISSLYRVRLEDPASFVDRSEGLAPEWRCVFAASHLDDAVDRLDQAPVLFFDEYASLPLPGRQTVDGEQLLGAPVRRDHGIAPRDRGASVS